MPCASHRPLHVGRGLQKSVESKRSHVDGGDGPKVGLACP